FWPAAPEARASHHCPSTDEGLLALVILLGPLADVVRWFWRLHPVEDLAALRLVLLIRDEPLLVHRLLVHRLEFAQLVRYASTRPTRSRRSSLAGVSTWCAS